MERMMRWRGVGRAAGSVGGGGGPFILFSPPHFCEPAMLEECISDHGHERMTMKTMPRPSLEVVEAELLLQLLMGLLTDPSRLDCGSQAAQIHPGGLVGKIVFLLSGHAVLAK